MYVLPFGVIKIFIARTRGRSWSDLDTAFVVAASSVMSPACKQLIHPVPFKQPWTHPDPTGSETKYEEFFGRYYERHIQCQTIQTQPNVTSLYWYVIQAH